MNRLNMSIIIFYIFGYSYFSACINSYFNYQNFFKEAESYCCIEVDANFFVVIVGFYGAIIAFFIPFSINMISKIGKMYETEIVAEKFKNEREVKDIHIHLLVGIILSGFILALHDTINQLFFSVIVFFIATHFLYVIYAIYTLIQKLRFYTDTDKVLEMLQMEITNVINR